jgi:hypothetical protein
LYIAFHSSFSFFPLFSHFIYFLASEHASRSAKAWNVKDVYEKWEMIWAHCEKQSKEQQQGNSLYLCTKRCRLSGYNSI